MKLLLIVGLFTSLYAGIDTLFEVDLKKLVALSTLRHLGFIVFFFFSWNTVFSFFSLINPCLIQISFIYITWGCYY